jgi:ribosome-binding factor A
MSVKGIDIGSECFDKMGPLDLSRRMTAISMNEDCRIATIFQNILTIRAQQEEGIVFACGALHAERLIDEFRKHGLQEEVLYYFPHLSSRYDERIDDINEVSMCDTLRGHTHLLSQRDIKLFGERVLREISGKTRYKQEIPEGNSHSQFLSEHVKTTFRFFLRPGYHVDALVDIAGPSDIVDIQKRVTAEGIQTHQIILENRRCLVIPNVNTEDIAERIRKIHS